MAEDEENGEGSGKGQQVYGEIKGHARKTPSL